MNKKGFTMVELLAVIVLLGVLGTIGVVATNKYLVQSREKSYRILSQTIYEAYENCAIEGNCELPAPGDALKCTSDNLKKLLVDKRYLENLKNPYNGHEDCTGTITVSAGNNPTYKDYIKYTYKVELICPGIKKVDYTWPNDKQRK